MVVVFDVGFDHLILPNLRRMVTTGLDQKEEDRLANFPEQLRRRSDRLIARSHRLQVGGRAESAAPPHKAAVCGLQPQYKRRRRLHRGGSLFTFGDAAGGTRPTDDSNDMPALGTVCNWEPRITWL